MKEVFMIDSWPVAYNGFMASPEQVAHLLRRTGFGIRPGRIRALADTDIHELIDERLADEGWSLSVEETNERNFEDVQWDLLPREWTNRILSPEAGLHERMVWFWHNHFTTNRHETNHRLMWRQHQLVRRNALGNLRDFATEIITDGAMLHFLDGDGSRGDAPNENFSREFMELFMLGRNAGYTEDDVRAGARILSGWYTDWETGDVGFDPEQNYDRPVRFLGTRRRWNIESYVDAVLAQPACAPHIVSRLHDYLTSMPLSDELRSSLANTLRSNDWEIRPVIAEILHHDDFTSAAGRRTRQPIEWIAGAAAAFDLSEVDTKGFDFWQMYQTGQVPFEPPNVAGWTDDERWSSASQVMARGNSILHWELSDQVINSLEPDPVLVLAHCGITDPSDSTLNALEEAIAAQTEYDRGLELLLTMTLLSPEFSTL